MTNTFILPAAPLQDERFVLRAPAIADVDEVHDACQDAAIQRFTFVPVPYERHHAQDWFADMPRARDAGEALSLAIEDRADGAFCGMASLLRPDWANAVVEVGYWVAPSARGRATIDDEAVERAQPVRWTGADGSLAWDHDCLL